MSIDFNYDSPCIELSYSWNTTSWKAQTNPIINYLSGGVREGNAEIYKSPCTEHEGFILDRNKQKLIKFHDLLNPPDFGKYNLFHSYRHPGHFLFYAGLVGVCLILILSLLIVYIKLYQKEKREKE